MVVIASNALTLTLDIRKTSVRDQRVCFLQRQIGPREVLVLWITNHKTNDAVVLIDSRKLIHRLYMTLASQHDKERRIEVHDLHLAIHRGKDVHAVYDAKRIRAMKRVRRHERRTRKHGIGGNRRLRSHRVKRRRCRGSRPLSVLLEGVADDRDGLQNLRPPTAQPFLQ